jgi:hypothetical protein
MNDLQFLGAPAVCAETTYWQVPLTYLISLHNDHSVLKILKILENLVSGVSKVGWQPVGVHGCFSSPLHSKWLWYPCILLWLSSFPPFTCQQCELPLLLFPHPSAYLEVSQAVLNGYLRPSAFSFLLWNKQEFNFDVDKQDMYGLFAGGDVSAHVTEAPVFAITGQCPNIY